MSQEQQQPAVIDIMTNTTAETPTWAEDSAKATKKMSQTLFFLTAYSLTGAALMGSSIGLVVYQSRQFFFLNTATRFELFHPHSNHTHDPSHPHGPGPHPGPHPGHGHGPHHGPDSDHPDHPDHLYNHSFFQTLFFSTWLPVLAWFVSLFLSSLFFKTRNIRFALVPKVIPARTGILISQFIFAVFWIILGAIQEVQERLLTQRRTSSGLDFDPIVGNVMDDGTNGDSEMEMSLEMKDRVEAMAAPLCTVWYLAVVLLGVSTGLLAACSSLMEKQLEESYQGAVVDGDVEEKEGLLEKYADEKYADEKYADEKYADEKYVDEEYAVEKKVNTGKTLAAIPETMQQKVGLVGLIVVLFTSQMKLFHWIIQAQSVAAYRAGTTSSVSTCLTTVGLLSGTFMILLGYKFLPRT